jgi:hypothetical protein
MRRRSLRLERRAAQCSGSKRDESDPLARGGEESRAGFHGGSWLLFEVNV